jgi:diguanylate cyclase (GGDEF)-like protein
MGSAAWLFMHEISADYQLMIIFAIAGLTAASAGAHAVDLMTVRFFMYPACGMTVVKLLADGKYSNYSLALMFLFYIMIMERVARQTNKTLHDNFQLTQTMHYRATHDALVGLLNREEFEHQFEQHVPKTPHGVAMIFLDLDNFKPLNDTLGHQAGDQALQKVADILSRSVRQDDAIARLGGDEFVILLFLDDCAEAEKISQSIIRDISKMPFPEAPDYSGLTASIGISFSSHNQVSFSQLMRAADSACYQSKEQGKNRVTSQSVGQMQVASASA